MKSQLAGQGLKPVLRVELTFSGCCDPALGLRAGEPGESDALYELEGITLAVSPETEKLAGDITIAYLAEGGREGFVITSANPVSEWAGFGVCSIKT